jgi:hypothetical protein
MMPPLAQPDVAPMPWFGSRSLLQRHQFWRYLAMMGLALGAVARISQYLSRRSFWHDEALVILNLRARTFWQCLGSFEHLAPTPPAFLLIAQAARHFLGESELSLRLASLLFSLAALAIVGRIAGKILSPPGAALGILLFALSDKIIMHSAELKPYSFDIFVACVLLWSALGNGLGNVTPRRFWCVGAIAALGLWFSYPSLFIFAGISFSVLLTMDWRSAKAWLNFLLVNLAVGASLAVLYRLAIAPQATGSLYAEWGVKFADWSHPASVPLWCLKNTYGVAEYAAVHAGPIVLVFAILGGVFLLRTRGIGWFAMLVGPIALLFVAGLLRVYPYLGERVSVFVAPSILLLAGFGLEATISLRWRSLRLAGWVLSSIVTIILVVQAGFALVYPRTHSHVRPAIEYLRAHRHPGDALWIVSGTTSVDYLCYEKAPDALTRLDVELPVPPLPAGRFWLLFGPAGQDNRRREPFLEPAGAQARMLDSFVTHDGAAYLFEKQ